MKIRVGDILQSHAQTLINWENINDPTYRTA